MPSDTSAAIHQMNQVLSRFRQVEQAHRRYNRDGTCFWTEVPPEAEAEVVALLTHTVERFRPPGKVAYGDDAIARLVNNPGGDHGHNMRALAGMLTSLRDEYQASHLQSF